MATMPSPPAPVNKYVVLANYTVTATDGTNTVDFQSQAQFTVEQTQNEDGTPFYTSYADLTEAQVIGWIQEEQNLVVNIEANLDGQIDSIVNPLVSPQITQLPW